MKYYITGGIDADKFTIDENTGQLSFKEPPVYVGSPSPSPTPAPTPVPTPPPAPPPSGTLLTAEEVEEVIAHSIGLNEGNIANVANGGAGWVGGSGIAMGSKWRNRDKPWDWPSGIYGLDHWWKWFTHWGVLFSGAGNPTTEGWIDVKGMDWQILYNAASSWTRYKPVTNAFGWISNFAPNMVDDLDVTPDMRAGLDGGISVKMPQYGAPHFVPDHGLYEVPNPENIEGVYSTMLVRIDPRGASNVKALAHVGGDPKPSTNGRNYDFSNEPNNRKYYPGFAVSRAINITASWRRVAIVNVVGGRDNPAGRTMTQQRLRDIRPLR
jgi:hypothetical protein